MLNILLVMLNNSYFASLGKLMILILNKLVDRKHLKKFSQVILFFFLIE